MAFRGSFLYTEMIKKPIKKLICLTRGVKSGTNTFISWRAEIINPKKIELGSDAVIERYARLVANGDLAEIKLGDNTYLHPYVLLKADNGKINIGKNCTVNDYAILYGHGGLIIGDDVHIGAHVVISPVDHIYLDPNVAISKQGISKVGITIEDDVLICASAVILDGTRVGKGCVIGAGAVVTESIPPYSVAAGVPARVIKQRK